MTTTNQPLRVGFIGTGRKMEKPGPMGYAMAYQHANAYRALPELSARRALNATEIIFAAYESSRRRARIDLPLEIEDNPLLSMVEGGDLRPVAAASG